MHSQFAASAISFQGGDRDSIHIHIQHTHTHARTHTHTHTNVPHILTPYPASQFAASARSFQGGDRDSTVPADLNNGSATQSFRSQPAPTTPNFAVLPATPASQHAALWRSMHGASFSKSAAFGASSANIMEGSIDAREHGKYNTDGGVDPASSSRCMRLPPLLSMSSSQKSNNTPQLTSPSTPGHTGDLRPNLQQVRAGLSGPFDQSLNGAPGSPVSPSQAWQNSQHTRDPSHPPWLTVIRSNSVLASPGSSPHVSDAAVQQQQNAPPSVRSPRHVTSITPTVLYPIIQPQQPPPSQQALPPRHPNSQQASFQQPNWQLRQGSSSPHASFQRPNSQHGQGSSSPHASFQQPNPNQWPLAHQQGSFSQQQPAPQQHPLAKLPHLTAFSRPPSLPRSQSPPSLHLQEANSRPSSLSILNNNHGSSQPPPPIFPPTHNAQGSHNMPPNNLASMFSPHMPLHTPTSAEQQQQQQPFPSAFAPPPPRTSAFGSVPPRTSAFSPTNPYPRHYMPPGSHYGGAGGYTQSMPPYFSVEPATNFAFGRGGWG